MYVPPEFAETDRPTLHALIRENSFGIIVSVTADGPVATHIPFVLETGGDGPDVLCGHVAQANPHWKEWGKSPEAMVIFPGPHAYISPSWYARQPAVPTWNYVAVHAYGRIELVTDPEAMGVILATLTAQHETDDPPAWRFEDLPADYRRKQIKGIVGLRIFVDRLEGKLKLSQNRPAEDPARVVSALESRGGAGDREIAAAMRRFSVVESDSG